MATKNSDLRRRSAVNRSARASVCSGIKEKFAFFFIAFVSFIVLTWLDGTKARYDIRHDKNNASTIYVNNDFIKELNIAEERMDVKEWLQNPAYFKYHQFANQTEFVNALGARAAAEYTRLQAENRDTQKSKELMDTFHSQSDFIHQRIRSDLPRVMLELRNQPGGRLDPLFDPVLNEGNSLNIIFQVMRMTTLVIIVLSFVFIVVMAFQMLPFASGATTASDHLRSLISLKGAAAAGEVAKVAIIGVTAVGVGTAVVVGGQALQGAGNALVSSSPGNGSSGPGNLQPTYTIQPPTVNTPHPIEINVPDIEIPEIKVPEIKVPQATVLDRSTVITRDTATILAQLRAVIQALPTAKEVTELKTRVEMLQNNLLRPNTACNCAEALKAIKESIDKLKLPPQLLISPDNQAVQINFEPLKTAINALETEVKKSNELAQAVDDRSILARTGDFIRGADYFAVSRTSFDGFIKALGSTSLNPDLKKALEDMIGLPPQRKSQFLISLHARAERAGSSKALDELKKYEGKILSKFKLPN